METMTDFSTLVVDTCCHCGLRFAVPIRFQEARRDDHADFYCPNGHKLVYTANEKDKLQREVNLLKSQREQAEAREARLRLDKKQLENRVRGQKAAKTRLANRLKNGVCPCCNRYFAELHQHMQSQHPDYADLHKEATCPPSQS